MAWGVKHRFYSEAQAEQKYAISCSCWYVYGQKLREEPLIAYNTNQWDLYNNIEAYLLYIKLIYISTVTLYLTIMSHCKRIFKCLVLWSLFFCRKLNVMKHNAMMTEKQINVPQKPDVSFLIHFIMIFIIYIYMDNQVNQSCSSLVKVSSWNITKNIVLLCLLH